MYFSSTLAVVAALVASCAGHSLMKYPPVRGNTEFFGTCGAGLGCHGPCDNTTAGANVYSPYYPKRYVQRGQEIDVQWSRANHPGGFVRLAIVPTDQSDSWDAFNDNVLKYSCYESNCGPDNPQDMIFGYLNGNGTEICDTKLTIPENIPDNTMVTLQWIWFGGGVWYAQPDTSFGEYYSCSDMVVNGGPTSKDKSKATFKGGDVTYPNSDYCKYWGHNKVGDCNFAGRNPVKKPGDFYSQTLEPCTRGSYSKKGKPYGF